MAGFSAEKLYGEIKNLPIIDYHCHLDPKEIYEDRPFTSIGDLWLSADHYKWRLMRTAGVDEKYITGDAPMREKYDKFVQVLSTAFNSPVKEWSQAELETYFGVTLKISSENADEIWESCKRVIEEEQLSPRKIMRKSNVAYVCTTDDVASNLYYHGLLKDFDITVAPGFRTDNLVNVADSNYLSYLEKLGKCEDVAIDSLSALKEVIKRRLFYFIKYGCKFSDIGAEGFPSDIFSEVEADKVLKKVLRGDVISAAEADGFKGNLYLYLGKLYRTYGIVQQWHLGALRNANTMAEKEIGRDSGFDCVGDIIPVIDVRNMLDRLNSESALPETVIYTLNPAMNYPLASLCGSFRGVHLGIAWWFNDHRRGMNETFNVLSELGHIENLVGMLTDSRSFLSYVRHDLYRRLLCGFLADNAASDEYGEALSVAKKLCYFNALNLIGG